MLSKLLHIVWLSVFYAASFVIWSCSIDAVSNFSMNGIEYDCDNGELICLGNAHVFTGLVIAPYQFPGTLSLTYSDYFEDMVVDGTSAGIAYYSQPIRLLDPSTNRSASFSTNFQFYEIPYTYEQNNMTYYQPGDGMTFVISANNSAVGTEGPSFGIFDLDRMTRFKCIVVEFDSYQNTESEINDISDNHVSLDIHNIAAVVARNASEVDIWFPNQTAISVWIDYTANTQMLEVRISKSGSRPENAFISHTVDLSEAVEEYMWVGFSAGNGAFYSGYYIGNWTFQSNGIPDKAYVSPDAPNAAKARHKSSTGIDVKYSVGIGAPFVSMVLILALWFLRKKRAPFWGARSWHGQNYSSSASSKHLTEQFGTEEGFHFGYEELYVATKGFPDEGKLGEGGSGCVYRGELPTSKISIAVKRVVRESELGEKAFKAEVSIISQLRHRNLLRLLGWCADNGEYYIVYDLMPNGSLDKLLFRPQNDIPSLLSWPQRLNIIQGVAAAVEYLHNGWKQQVIHRDIKASTIMLDDKWNPKLGDFGLARLGDHQRTPSTTVVAGTFGYMAPDVLSSRRFTEKTDVFAFGALCLEIACGSKCFAPHLDSEMVLVDCVWECLSHGELLSVVDQRLSEYDEDQITVLLLLGLACSHPDPAARPSMRAVGQVLRGEVAVPFVPASKPYPVYQDFRMDAFSTLEMPDETS